jgi:AbiV family abortive infection protein
MPKKGLNQFRGKLEAAQAAAGMNAASTNARRLLADAKLLLEAGSYPTAAAIAILAIEEAGKVSILRELILARNDKELSEAWRNYRAHTKKNAFWIMPQLAAAGARQLEDLRPMVDENSDHPQVLDQLKQLAFYTDCLGDAHWSQPEKIIQGDLARTLVHTAEVLAAGREVTALEIDLWIKHIKPVWKRDMTWMKTALSHWHQEMVSAGLAAEDDGFDNFVRGGQPKKPE